MLAWRIHKAGERLRPSTLPDPRPRAGEIVIRVDACGVCRTDLHLLDGELPPAPLPITPGHQIVGSILSVGDGVETLSAGQRVGVPWLGWTCGACRYCTSARENLCDLARFTGYHIDGGYSDLAVADHRFCFPLPDSYDDFEAAPLLCAGMIGYRALRMTGDAQRIGFYGIGSSAQILLQIAVHQKREIFAFTRPGDSEGQSFAKHLGAVWAGGSDAAPLESLDAAILFAPAGELVPLALKAVAKGGIVVCAGIHMTDIPSFPYEILWGERSVKSVANLTRSDGEELFRIASEVQIRPRVQRYPLERCNEALDDLRAGRVAGSAVLSPSARYS